MKKSLAIILLTLGLCAQASALTLNEARSQGRVGETLDGYLAPVAQDRETLALVAQINQARSTSLMPAILATSSTGMLLLSASF